VFDSFYLTFVIVSNTTGIAHLKHIHKFITKVWHTFLCNGFWDVFKRDVVIKNHLLCTYVGVSGFECLGAVHRSDLSVFLTYASLKCTIILCLRL